MTIEPIIEARSVQPYVAERMVLTMQTLPRGAQRIPAIADWITAQGSEPVGAPFYKFDVIDMAHELVLQVGFPVTAPVPPASPGTDMVCGQLPAGRYVTAVHAGHPDGLVAATAELLDWTAARGERFDMAVRPDGEHWGCRLVTWLTDPAVEPDMNRWRTELAFRLSD